MSESSRDYSIRQISNTNYWDDRVFPITMNPSICNNGRRVVFSGKQDPARYGYVVWLYDRDADEEEPHVLIIQVDGDERTVAATNPQISGDGEKIIFSSKAFYTSDSESGTYIYDISSETTRLVITDLIPRYDSGLERTGEPDLARRVSRLPSISTNGEWISYLDRYYNPAEGISYDRLFFANIEEERIRGTDLLQIPLHDAHGLGIHAQSISGNGRKITFYAGGEVEGLEVSNLEMPAYEEVRHDEHSMPTCNVYCYIVTIIRVNQYRLEVVPDPDSPAEPLIISHPFCGNINSYNSANILSQPPSICFNGTRVALVGGHIYGESKTGVYMYEPGFNRTYKIISFDSRPGTTPMVCEEPLITGSHPSISGDGRWLSYCIREVLFNEGYHDRGSYREDMSYCPQVQKDDVVVQRIPHTHSERNYLIESRSNPATPMHTSWMGLSINHDGSHVTFVSRADKTGSNRDHSHEIFLASEIE